MDISEEKEEINQKPASDEIEISNPEENPCENGDLEEHQDSILDDKSRIESGNKCFKDFYDTQSMK